MKTYISTLMIAALISVFPLFAAAQNSIDVDGIDVRLPNLNNANDQQLLQQRAKECVRQMNTYISSMTKKQSRDNNGELHPTLQDRQDSKMAALELFLENGDSIMLSNGVKGAPALMETTSRNSSGRVISTTRPVKIYFKRLIDLIIGGKYTDVTITSTDIENMDVTNIVQVGNRYQCVVTYTQDFIGRRGEISAYADRTKKQIVVWFVFYDSPWGREIVPRLGDISCKETQRL